MGDELISDPVARAAAERGEHLPDPPEHLWLDALWLWSCRHAGFPDANELAAEMMCEWDDPVSVQEAQAWLAANFPAGRVKTHAGEPREGYSITGAELADTTYPGTDRHFILWRLYDRKANEILYASYEYEELAEKAQNLLI